MESPAPDVLARWHRRAAIDALPARYEGPDRMAAAYLTIDRALTGAPQLEGPRPCGS